MKKLPNILNSLFDVGRAGYDPGLHKFTVQHFWLATRWFFFAACFFFLLLLCFGLSIQWYASYSLKAGDENTRRGNHERAVRCYTSAIKYIPETEKQLAALAYHNRGLAQVTLGQVEQATTDFNRAHELDASLPALTLES